MDGIHGNDFVGRDSGSSGSDRRHGSFGVVLLL
jgi:hypothetical protein